MFKQAFSSTEPVAYSLLTVLYLTLHRRSSHARTFHGLAIGVSLTADLLHAVGDHLVGRQLHQVQSASHTHTNRIIF